ncbi:RNA ligase family protein [Hydrogenophaga sp.]|uniref:RNA ligase family protein n=1 Tax=Hydrogenophaga sp. TaxID=1904254 RepID=UPI00272338CE|nr:RNA ligase family protein [Hydrogenophaga sp.]MDO9435512.1 RNA ligase family protein [Hydrogenophaga sp.]
MSAPARWPHSRMETIVKFIQSLELARYPRTPHLQGSRLQDGDDASDQMPLARLAGQRVVIEEKLDGGNCGLSFSEGGDLLLQSRGHYLVGGGSERQFNWLKPWAQAHAERLLARLEDRWVLYGEAMYAKHSVFYDRLPHLLLEFDLLERASGKFLSTPRRKELLQGLPIVSVPVLYEGPMPTDPKQLKKLVYRSLAKSRQWRERFERQVAREGLPLDLTWQQTNAQDESEGLYLKVENEDFVEARFKWVRPGFTQTILDSGSHHLARPMLPNLLADGVDLYAPTPTVDWEALGLTTLSSIDALRGFDPKAFVEALP